MENKKRKKHTDADKLKYMHLLSEGMSARAIQRQYGIDYALLQVLWRKYKQFGPAAIKKSKNTKTDFALKSKIICDIEKNNLTLYDASFKYGVSNTCLKVWLRIARKQGLDALRNIKPVGRSPNMNKQKKKSKPLTELEKLRQENLELRTENALLKKVKALVEAREARLKEIGQKPSKN